MKDSSFSALHVKQVIHDTLSQTLFSTSTLTGVLINRLDDEHQEVGDLVLEIDSLVKNALNELEAIQILLQEMSDTND